MSFEMKKIKSCLRVLFGKKVKQDILEQGTIKITDFSNEEIEPNVIIFGGSGSSGKARYPWNYLNYIQRNK
ncbi:MAG: hypothetical protein H6Q27_876 [Ignavibacteriaceae bacterium]|nr:hypothetical protein [Ignavibacteriaceae bacterium]